VVLPKKQAATFAVYGIVLVVGRAWSVLCGKVVWASIVGFWGGVDDAECGRREVKAQLANRGLNIIKKSAVLSLF